MKYFLDNDFKHWGVMPNSFDERRDIAYCPECNKPMHPHYIGEPKEIGLTGRQMVEVKLRKGVIDGTH